MRRFRSPFPLPLHLFSFSAYIINARVRTHIYCTIIISLILPRLRSNCDLSKRIHRCLQSMCANSCYLPASPFVCSDSSATFASLLGSYSRWFAFVEVLRCPPSSAVTFCAHTSLNSGWDRGLSSGNATSRRSLGNLFKSRSRHYAHRRVRASAVSVVLMRATDASLKKWTPAVQRRAPDNIVSSDYTTAKVFVPSYEKYVGSVSKFTSNTEIL